MTLGVLSVAMVSALLWLTASRTSLLSLQMGASGVGAGGGGALALPEPMPSWPSPEELLVNWPRFRGAVGGGVSTSPDLPTQWDAPDEVGIVWKSAVPAQGFNSPIVWGDRLYLSGGGRENRSVFAYDVSTGRLVWTCPVKGVAGSPVEPPDIPEETGFAAATMATDGRLVFVMFANGDLAGVGLDGTIVWSKNLGVPKNPFGHATSLIVWRDQLIVQMDQDEGEKNGSAVYSLDTATGRSLWRRTRPVPSSWATPIVIEPASGPQLITLGDPWVIAYKPSDGTELWRAECLEGEVTPSPVYAAGMIFLASPSSRLVAVRPDGQGDVTASQIAWQSEAEIPDITSPVANDQRVFTVNSWGVLTCFSTVDGSRVWEHELNMDVHASPSLAGDQLYLISVTGTLVVADVRTEFREVWRQEFGEKVSASPAFAGGRIFVRGEKQLFCIGRVEKPVEVQTVERSYGIR
jgi:outer membrane protein assembly factor BamB